MRSKNKAVNKKIINILHKEVLQAGESIQTLERNIILPSISAAVIYTIKTQQRKLIIKIYTENGFPFNEKACLQLIEQNKLYNSPRIYFFGCEEKIGNYLIEEYLEGNSLENVIQGKKQIGSFDNIKNIILRLIEEYTLSYYKSLSKEKISPVSNFNDSWLTKNMSNVKKLYIKAITRLVRRIYEKNFIDKKVVTQFTNQADDLSKILHFQKYHLCHGDLTSRNIIVDKRQQLTLIDWEYAFYGPLEKELGDLIFDVYFLADKLPLIPNDITNLAPTANSEIIKAYIIPQAFTRLLSLVKQKNQKQAQALLHWIKKWIKRSLVK